MKNIRNIVALYVFGSSIVFAFINPYNLRLESLAKNLGIYSICLYLSFILASHIIAPRRGKNRKGSVVVLVAFLWLIFVIGATYFTFSQVIEPKDTIGVAYVEKSDYETLKKVIKLDQHFKLEWLGSSEVIRNEKQAQNKIENSTGIRGIIWTIDIDGTSQNSNITLDINMGDYAMPAGRKIIPYTIPLPFILDMDYDSRDQLSEYLNVLNDFRDIKKLSITNRSSLLSSLTLSIENLIKRYPKYMGLKYLKGQVLRTKNGINDETVTYFIDFAKEVKSLPQLKTCDSLFLALGYSNLYHFLSDSLFSKNNPPEVTYLNLAKKYQPSRVKIFEVYFNLWVHYCQADDMVQARYYYQEVNEIDSLKLLQAIDSLKLLQAIRNLKGKCL